jgi:transposase
VHEELGRETETLTRMLAPQLLEQPGVGPLSAAQLLLSWSHQGRFPNEAAFARLAGVGPIPASSGQTIRYRLDRSGDRQLNRALHMIIVTRRRAHEPTIAGPCQRPVLANPSAANRAPAERLVPRRPGLLIGRFELQHFIIGQLQAECVDCLR